MSAVDPFATALRTRLAGSLRLADQGTKVKLGGWVQRQRPMGGIVFLDLRDRSGVVQVSFDPAFVDAETIRAASSVTRESVVLIEGEVVARPATMKNPEMVTGDVEVKALTLRVAGPAETNAFPPDLNSIFTTPPLSS